ncbi:phospholipase [Natronorubrum sp. JWXQ-INN-674]|uniref:Phospholipase n=1 Tax=Natronorubrum halalkaliphilum TaxID=2691917 RepID=A0A6B0VPY2_9EURY|nr:dienelactone hydrolase family protein [Natronorubrum halalkaliphilum]MXV62842.1 phospholipase [Natronorubrum halalkaliphilum]
MSAGDDTAGPHQDQPLVTGGTDLEDASAALVLTHGRGATARGMLQLATEVHREGVAFLAPQAAGKTWYPNSFLAPVERNEPGRTSGLRAVGDAIEAAADAGIPTDRVMLVGFSQGACLASEFVARNPRRYGGLAALSGGLIGEELDEEYPGDLEGTPAFLGCSDVDPHIPEERVHETADALESMNAEVTTRLYEGMGHGVNDDELEFVSEMVADLVD